MIVGQQVLRLTHGHLLDEHIALKKKKKKKAIKQTIKQTTTTTNIHTRAQSTYSLFAINAYQLINYLIIENIAYRKRKNERNKETNNKDEKREGKEKKRKARKKSLLCLYIKFK